jgi:hypothetical protein
MYEFFIFDFQSSPLTTRRRQRVSVIFSPTGGFFMQHLKDSLRTFFDEVMPPDVVLIVGTVADSKDIKALVDCEELHEYLPAFTRYSSPPQTCGLWQLEDGTFQAYSKSVASEKILEKSFVDSVMREGLVTIFKRRGGVLETGRAHHYRKPSGKHCDKFIRAGNALIRGAEVGFVAFCALPHLSEDMSHIYTDTAAINVVAYAMILLKRRMTPDCPIPTVDSYSSYEGLDKFRFELPSESLFLISASTSCDLEEQLIKRQAARRHILTLFYLGTQQEESLILCDLTQRGHESSGFETITSHAPDNCPWCRQGLPYVRIMGDQFLPENPKVVSVQIRKEDCPRWLAEFTREFVGKKTISCYYSPKPDSPNQKQEVYLDLAAIFERPTEETTSGEGVNSENTFLGSVDRILVRTIPATLRRIIYLDDPASKSLAERVNTIYKRSLNKAGIDDVRIENAKDIQTDLAAHVLHSGTTLVVAGVVVSGRRLLALSQSLRQIQRNSAIQYFVAVVRTQTSELFGEVRSNLQYGEHGANEHDFNFARRIFLADDGVVRSTSWEDETELLNKLEVKFVSDRVFVEALKRRRQQVISGLSDAAKGLRNELFWETSNDGKTLSIRRNFAFWDFQYDETTATQADVYFTITAILNNLRHSDRTSLGRLEQGEHHHAMISPRCFDRFNDGVIQASLLRAARPVELDYTADDRESQEMQRILDFVFGNFHNDIGEASVEFLIALALGRLRILPKHCRNALRLLRSTLASKERHPATHILETLCGYVEEQYGYKKEETRQGGKKQ